jgi:hypothetical protein
MKKLWMGLALFVAIAVVLLALDRRGRPERPGEVTRATVPAAWVQERTDAQARALAALGQGAPASQILFGDLHVHTTYSMDAFAWAMPLFHGQGVRPPAEACDFARFCADLDFWATTEHAESLTPRHWRDLRTTVQECNALAGDPANPDLVTFTGWEWTQMGDTAATHYGHKNVIFAGAGDDEVPTRPIGAGGFGARAMRRSGLPWTSTYIGPYLDFANRQAQFDQYYKMEDLAAQPLCPEGRVARDLPEDCIEFAETPRELFARLDAWGFDALVIPHGNTWGYYTPPGSSWDKQLGHGQHDPKRQTLVEVMSGHGNSEEFRAWREVVFDAQGHMHCPEPTPDYLPSCWRAGELIRDRCGDAPAQECERRVLKARADYLAAGRAGHLVVPGVTPEDWLDAGQCRDCYIPAFNYRPGGATQYALAISNFDEPGEDGDPLRFRFGFIASSDNHGAQPGTGYKELGRHLLTEAGGQEGYVRQSYLWAAKPREGVESVPYDLASNAYQFLQIAETERQQSFFYTGGLVAVHSAGRSREAIWDALKRREVYGTSGERMLLWFDVLDAGGKAHPMGSALKVAGTPRFRVRAVGAFEQLPGCPEHSVKALPADKLAHLCGGECNNPSDVRKPIERIEVVRIRPQQVRGEPVADLIEDPWRTFACRGDAAGCVVEFEDPDFGREKREYIYYVRALAPPTPTVNAGTLRCEQDGKGECVKVDPCHGDSRTPLTDDCLAPAAERAWSSPIYLKPR